MLSRRVLALLVLVLIAIIIAIGVIIQYALPTKTGKDRSPHDNPNTKSGLVKPTIRGSGSEDPSIIETDPLKEVYSVTALAIGDWGRTVAKEGGSCCRRRKNYTVVDYNAMEYTASLLGLAAASLNPKPSVIIGHGDNFYWTGLQSRTDQAYRFHETFETKYADPSLRGIPWINVMGNHDFGGASYICSSDNVPAPCHTSQEMLQGLEQKFRLQSTYVSPNDNRWLLSDRFYTYTLMGDTGFNTTSQMKIEIYNLDTNDADTHGAHQICCQCFSYSGGDDSQCENVKRGDPYCFGGDVEMYDVCMQQFSVWGKESRDQLEKAVNHSTAHWKLVNTHYSPYNHFAPEKAQVWKQVLEPLGIHVFLYGHTHGEKHDYALFKTHFIENGAGGGIQNESPSGIPPYAEAYVENIWGAGHYPYGIFALKISINWIRIEFMTFDDQWVMNTDLTKSIVGGIAIKHCWYIPRYGGRGKSCSDVQH